MFTENTIRKSSYSPSYSPETGRDYDYENDSNEHFEAMDALAAAEMYQESAMDLHDTLLPTRANSPPRNEAHFEAVRGQSPPPKAAGESLLKQLTAAPAMRRSSSSSGLAAQQRKGSLPSDYISNANSIALSSEWSRENVAAMSAMARQRQQNPPNSTSTSFKKIGVSTFCNLALIISLFSSALVHSAVCLPHHRWTEHSACLRLLQLAVNAACR